MDFSYTGIAYSLLFISLLFLNYRVFQYWQKSKDTISRLFLYFVVCLVFFVLLRAITGLFFATNPQVLYVSVGLVAFTEGVMAALVAYLVIHLKFPRIIPWIGAVFFLILGVLITLAHYLVKNETLPFVDQSGSINFNVGLDVQSGFLWYPLLRTFLLLFSFVALIFVNLRYFRVATDRYFKTRTLGLAIALFLGVLIGVSDFLVISVIKAGAVYRDATIAVLSVVLFLVVYFTQKPRPLEKETLTLNQ